MPSYSSGKNSKAISDRSGMEFPYKEMVREWNGSFVHVSEFEPKQPQLDPKPIGTEGVALRNIRPDRIENAGIKFQKKVRRQYEIIAKRFPDRIFTIDGSNSISSIHSTIWEKTINCINEKN